jgi:hypothetical protein
MTIPTSRENQTRGENSTRALSTADLAAARQSPRVRPDPREIDPREVEGEQSGRDRQAGETERGEAMGSLRGGDYSDVHRRRAETASDSQVTDDSIRDDDIGTARGAGQGVEIEDDRADEMRSGSLEPGNLRGNSGSPSGPADAPHDESLEPLFAAEQAEGFRNRWIAIQSSFVDDPSAAVQAGDELVAQVMSELANSFAGQRHRIESQLGKSGSGNTEDLRVALRSYRSFFERLLSL